MRDKILIGSAAASLVLGAIYLKNRVFLSRFRKEAEETLNPSVPATAETPNDDDTP